MYFYVFYISEHKTSLDVLLNQVELKQVSKEKRAELDKCEAAMSSKEELSVRKELKTDLDHIKIGQCPLRTVSRESQYIVKYNASCICTRFKV